MPLGAKVSQQADHHGRRRQHDEQPVGDGGDPSHRRAIAGHGHDHDAHDDDEDERGREAQLPPWELGGVQGEHQRGADKDGRDRPLDIARLSNALEDERDAEREEQHSVALPRALHPAFIRHRRSGLLRFPQVARAEQLDGGDRPALRAERRKIGYQYSVAVSSTIAGLGGTAAI